jgi:hypothetical protein
MLAADHGRRRPGLFLPIHQALAAGTGPGLCGGRRCDGRMGGSGLLCAGAKPAQMRAGRGVASSAATSLTTKPNLRALPGIGPYTAAAIASIAFDRPAPVLDGNIERVLSRLFAVTEPLPSSKPELKSLAARLTPDRAPRVSRASAHGPWRHHLRAEIAGLRDLSPDGGMRSPQGRDSSRPACQDAEESQARPSAASPILSDGRMERSCSRRDRPPGYLAVCWAGPLPTGSKAIPCPPPDRGALA